MIVGRVPVVVLLAACSRGGSPPPPEIALVDDMVTVPGGWFTGGCTGAADPRTRAHCFQASPPGRFWVSSFEIDRLEATRLQYARCVDAGACAPLPEPLRRGQPPGIDVDPSPIFPALVQWKQANAYCRWRGKLLATEVEWEKAARDGDDRVFPWGDEPPTCTRAKTPLRGCDDAGLAPVGSYPLGMSPYGALDMAGNVSEWVGDVRSRRGTACAPCADQGSGSTCGLADRGCYRADEVIDPTGPKPGDRNWEDNRDEHVCKGHDPEISTRMECDDMVIADLDPNFPCDDASGASCVHRHLEVAGIRCVQPIPGPAPTPDRHPLPSVVLTRKGGT